MHKLFTLAIFAAGTAVPLYSLGKEIYENTGKNKPDVVIHRSSFEHERYYDTSEDGTLDKRIDTTLLVAGMGMGLKKTSYSIEQHPDLFTKAQKEYNTQ